MLDLKTLLKNNIKRFGSISVLEFLNIVLYHEKLGYYRKKNIIGKKGDFITSPEISQVFGEIIINSFLINLNIIDKKNKISFVELGPGRGFLSQDILRTIKKVNDNLFQNIEKVYFLEKSKGFFNNLKKIHNRVNIIDDLSQITNSYNLIFANEFFDALPVKQFIFKNKKWYEIKVSLNEKEDFIFTYSTKPSWIDYFFPKNPNENYVFEYSEYMVNVLSIICNKINSFGGVCYIIDYYRNTNNNESTLSAIKKHTKVDIFHDLGNCDISHNPDFELIEKICLNNGCVVHGPYTQSTFLENYGINERISFLISKNPELKKELLLQKERLIKKEYMGDIFKVIVVTDKNYNYNFL